MLRGLQPGAVLAAAGMLLAITSGWGRPAGDWDGLVLPAAVAVYAGLIMTWHAAVARMSGPPTVWFTAAVPCAVALIATATEALHANGYVFDTSAISLLLVPVSLVVTFAGARRAGRRWTSGAWAWSLVLFHLGVSVGALAGIPLGTFGSETRSDELLLWGGVLPLGAIAVALPFAPRTPWQARLAGPVLVAAVVPATLVTGTAVAGVVVITLLVATTMAVGSLPGREAAGSVG